VIAKYYTRITLRRLTDLLDLTSAESEAALSKLVVKKTIYAKIDRVDGIVSFVPRQDCDEVIDKWSKNVGTLLDLISTTNHLIAKEEMIQSITQTMVIQ
jgi:26S proteasome regulatory subunit N5